MNSVIAVSTSENVKWCDTICLRPVVRCFPSVMIDFLTALLSGDCFQHNIIAAIASIVVENNRFPNQSYSIYYAAAETSYYSLDR